MIEWNNQSLIVNFFCSISLALGIGYLGFKNIHQEFRSRNSVEKIIISLLGLSSIIAILTTIGIVFSVIFESYVFLQLYLRQNFYLD